MTDVIDDRAEKRRRKEGRKEEEDHRTTDVIEFAIAKRAFILLFFSLLQYRCTNRRSVAHRDVGKYGTGRYM